MLPANDAIKRVESGFLERFDINIPGDDAMTSSTGLSEQTGVALCRKSGMAEVKLRPGAGDKRVFLRVGYGVWGWFGERQFLNMTRPTTLPARSCSSHFWASSIGASLMTVGVILPDRASAISSFASASVPTMKPSMVMRL